MRTPIGGGFRFGPPDGEDDRAEAVLRDAFARWSSGVSVLAVRHAAGVSALTASAVAPLSLRPPLVLACVGGDAPLLSHAEDVKRFVVNILSAEQRGLAARFADRFTLGAGVFPAHGDPILDGALAALVCRVDSIVPGGDHRILIGAVERTVLAPRAGGPLVYFDRDYRTLA